MTTYENADEVMARVDAQTRQAVETMQRAQAFASEATRLRGRATWRGVGVVVDAHGMLKDVTFTESAVGLGARHLAQAALVAHTAALKDAALRVARCAEQTWGDDPLAQRVVSETYDRFGVEQ